MAVAVGADGIVPDETPVFRPVTIEPLGLKSGNRVRIAMGLVAGLAETHYLGPAIDEVRLRH